MRGERRNATANASKREQARASDSHEARKGNNFVHVVVRLRRRSQQEAAGNQGNSVQRSAVQRPPGAA